MASFYQRLKPLLFRLDAEQAHDLTTALLRVVGRVPVAQPLLRAIFAYDHPLLAVRCAGLDMVNPVGLAAGFDKRGELVGPLGALGFGHVEVGTVTPRPQPGNPRPRMFRLPEDNALINRLGFNSPGMIVAAQNLRRHVSNTTNHHIRHSTPTRSAPMLGVNLGKNRNTPNERAVEDYAAAFVALAPLADYVTINISSPNTPGLRLLHERAALEELLHTLTTLNRRLEHPRPLLLKVSPDETPAQLDDVVRAACDSGIDGFIAGNTTLSREELHGAAQAETGGLSGQPLTRRARATIAHLYRATSGRLPVIGVGGVADAADAYAHIRAGATMIQVYTGLVYQGPALPHIIKRGLVAHLQRDGFTHFREAVGTSLQGAY